MLRNRYTKFAILVIAIFFGCVAAERVQAQSETVSLEAKDSDLSISLPSDSWIVDTEKNMARVYRYAEGSQILISMTSGEGRKEAFKEWASKNRDGAYKFAQKGDFLIAQKIDEKELHCWLHVASSKGAYTISIFATKANATLYGSVLSSIKLRGQRLLNGSSPEATITRTISVSSLEPSTDALAALDLTDSKQKKLLKADSKATPPPNVDYLAGFDAAGPSFSRGLILLRRPRPMYTDSARQASTSGTVKLKVTFMASGELGDIELLESVGNGLDEEAFRAAKKIKFLPAMVDGKPVDTVRSVFYNFAIH